MANININPQLNIGNVAGVNSNTQGVPAAVNKGPSFRDELEKINSSSKSLENVKSKHKLLFSNHAIERMQLRGVSYSPEQLEKIESALAKAEQKGAKDTLVLTDSSALIVNVKNRTVVTVMDKENLKENVFTKIDSTVVI